MEIKRLDFLLSNPDQTVWYDLLPHSGTLAGQKKARAKKIAKQMKLKQKQNDCVDSSQGKSAKTCKIKAKAKRLCTKPAKAKWQSQKNKRKREGYLDTQ